MRSPVRQGVRCAEASTPQDAEQLLTQAQALVGASAPRQPLSGRKLAVLSTELGDDDAREFLLAAGAIGAHVSFVNASLDDASSPGEIETTARVLSLLYDAVECQHLPDTLVRRLAQSADVPVFAGLATAGHPTAALAGEMDLHVPHNARRRSILQAALLLSLK